MERGLSPSQEVGRKERGVSCQALSLQAGDPKYVNESKIQPGEHEGEKVVMPCDTYDAC